MIHFPLDTVKNFNIGTDIADPVSLISPTALYGVLAILSETELRSTLFTVIPSACQDTLLH